MTKTQISILSFLTTLQHSVSALFDYKALLLCFCHSWVTFHISKVMFWISRVFCRRSGGTGNTAWRPHHQGDDRSIPFGFFSSFPSPFFLSLSLPLFYPMLCLLNFPIWFRAWSQAAVAEQLWTVGSDGGKQQKSTLLPNMPWFEQGELWHPSLYTKK